MPDTDPATVAVSIYGKTFTFALGPDQKAEHIHRVAQFMDEKMREAHEAHRTQSPLQTAVLAGLNLVDELFKLQAEYQTAESDIAQRTTRLTDSLGRVFQDSETDSAASGTN